MLEQAKIDRINELSRKKKAEGLTANEKIEQEELRREYLKSFRTHMKGTIENTTIIDPNGKDITPKKSKTNAKKKGSKLNEMSINEQMRKNNDHFCVFS
ncbi:hypothetical protein MFLO_03320 [Listeria floridensis FSL S10-1187]|uniref:UPF0291 protein MFLO_03320 n=1 Tax=Listeria floridensis FSL S10-1187 TaxID=1265817 RepID=A0ABP3B0H5_9LIST|nr:hypothetical protein MFLO_03320 [Listeria floridensis FSL S10-1187]